MSKLTIKGQVTIPKDVREQLGLRPGDEVEFYRSNGGFGVRKQFDVAAFDAAIKKWTGYIKDLDGVTVDEYIEEMRGR